GLPVEEAYARRHESNEIRTFWFNAGNELRENGPTTLIRKALEYGDITGGVRDRAEVLGSREEKLVDLIIWVDNYRSPHDPTLMFDSSDCDIIIENHGSLKDFYRRIERFARFANL